MRPVPYCEIVSVCQDVNAMGENSLYEEGIMSNHSYMIDVNQNYSEPSP